MTFLVKKQMEQCYNFAQELNAIKFTFASCHQFLYIPKDKLEMFKNVFEYLYINV